MIPQRKSCLIVHKSKEQAEQNIYIQSEGIGQIVYMTVDWCNSVICPGYCPGGVKLTGAQACDHLRLFPSDQKPVVLKQDNLPKGRGRVINK